MGKPIEDRLRRAGLPPLRRLAWLEVDLSALESNAMAIRSLLPAGCRLGIVTKAGGYGHGLVAVSRAGAAGGADLLVVATLDEAVALREAGLTLPVLAIYPVPPREVLGAVRAEIDLVVADDGSLADVVAAMRDAPGGTPEARVHLAVDTGMTRGGFAPDRAASAALRLTSARGIHLAAAWSHLATPERPDAVALQVERFERARALLAEVGLAAPAHIAATAGLFGTAPAYDVVRIGLAFYGVLPPELEIAAAAAPVAGALRPAIALKARAASVSAVPAGAEVGYGGAWRAERDSTIAVLPFGYADGWTRLYSPGSSALVAGRRVPVVGRVSSDAIAVDVTDAGPLARDAEFVLLGEQGHERIDVHELAAARRSISWEVLDALGDRLARVYVRDALPVGLLEPGRSMAAPVGAG